MFSQVNGYKCGYLGLCYLQLASEMGHCLVGLSPLDMGSALTPVTELWDSRWYPERMSWHGKNADLASEMFGVSIENNSLLVVGMFISHYSNMHNFNLVDNRKKQIITITIRRISLFKKMFLLIPFRV